MIAVKLKVRGHVGRKAAEFELDLLSPEPPYVWMPRSEGRGGESSPLFLAEVKWSAVFACYVCVCEDDVADDLGSFEELVAAYERKGWRAGEPFSLVAHPPAKGRRQRRAAS